ncbi:MAG TPA: hypothetical protein DEF47_21970 [Herpetosiphon sp.]|uniref:WD-40 repeat protein n=1 Tax=Herpetosiphon aurantiacus (strain ATCC 23779 / DSM 785 / 114-95) TaxID=316274 RepID=A9AW24_HERA2|nr:hypothetical protein [Herpetosiphon sp.]ABX03262.1 WD-40 repeat protein [Herpetosiphon aurantiacus DSM 785]HBW52558.1 hypothetical protein [Herpetosiphon sp.]
MLRRTFWVIIVGILLVLLNFKINGIELLPNWLGLLLIFGALLRLQQAYVYFKRATWLSFFALGQSIPWFESPTTLPDDPWYQYGFVLSYFFYGIYLWMIGEICYALVRYQRLAEPERSNRPLVLSYLALMSHLIFLLLLWIWPALGVSLLTMVALGIGFIAYAVVFFQWQRYTKRLNSIDFGIQHTPRFAAWLKVTIVILLIVPLLGLSSTWINPTNPLVANEPTATAIYRQKFSRSYVLPKNPIAYSPDGSMLALIDKEIVELPEELQNNYDFTITKLYLLDTADYSKQRVITLGDNVFVTNMTWNHTGSQIFVSLGRDSSTINYIIDPIKADIKFSKEGKYIGFLNSARWSADDRIITLLANSVWEFNAITGEMQIISRPIYNPSLKADLSPDSQYIVYRDELQDSLDIYRSPDWIAYTNLQKNIEYVYNLSWSNDQKLIAVAKSNDEIQVWDAASGQSIHSLLITYQDDRWWNAKTYATFAQSVTFSLDSTLIAGGSHDGNMMLWQVDDGRRLLRFDQQQSGIIAIAIKPHNQHMASIDEDGNLLIWDIMKVVQ